MSTEELLMRLEKDKTFRLAVAGLIGYKEILERLNEHDKKFEEILERLGEHDKKFEELLTELKRQGDVLQEHTKILQEHTRKLSEYGKRFEELDKKVSSLERSVDLLGKRVEVTIGSMGRRWGVDLERTTLEIFREVLEEKGIEPGKVSKFRLKDADGTYTGVRGKIIDVDILIKDDKLYIMEVKSYAELDHVQTLYEKIKPIEKALNRKVEKSFLIAVNIDEEAYEKAKELGIEVITGNIIKMTEHST